MRAIFVILMLLLPATLAAAQPLTTSDGGSRPIPDPTVLTTQAQKEAIATLRELVEAKIHAIEDALERQRLTMDRVDNRLIQRIDETPALIEKALAVQQQLTNEKFKGVDQQFQGRDVALAAALLAQKTSVDEQNKANAASSAKQEGAITKQIDGIQSIILANSKGTDDKIDGVRQLLANQSKNYDDKIADLRNQVSVMSSAVSAGAARGAGQGDLWSYIIAGGGLLTGFAAVALTLSRGRPMPPNYYQPQPTVAPSSNGNRT